MRGKGGGDPRRRYNGIVGKVKGNRRRKEIDSILQTIEKRCKSYIELKNFDMRIGEKREEMNEK